MNTFTTRKKSLIGAALFLLLGIFTFAQMAALDEPANSSDPGAAGYPRLIAGVMIVLAVLLALQRDPPDEPVPRHDVLRVLGAIALLIVYILTLEPLGYIVSTLIMVVGAMLLMGVRTIIPLVVVPVGVTLANFYIFYTVFGVPLPFAHIERLLI